MLTPRSLAGWKRPALPQLSAREAAAGAARNRRPLRTPRTVRLAAVNHFNAARQPGRSARASWGLLVDGSLVDRSPTFGEWTSSDCYNPAGRSPAGHSPSAISYVPGRVSYVASLRQVSSFDVRARRLLVFIVAAAKGRLS